MPMTRVLYTWTSLLEILYRTRHMNTQGKITPSKDTETPFLDTTEQKSRGKTVADNNRGALEETLAQTSDAPIGMFTGIEL